MHFEVPALIIYVFILIKMGIRIFLLDGKITYILLTCPTLFLQVVASKY